jgi:hypothetical protein
LFLGHPTCLEVLGQVLSLLIEEVAHPLQEEHAENVFFVLGRIHVPAQVVAGAEQEAGELAECKLAHRGNESITGIDRRKNTRFRNESTRDFKKVSVDGVQMRAGGQE